MHTPRAKRNPDNSLACFLFAAKYDKAVRPGVKTACCARGSVPSHDREGVVLLQCVLVFTNKRTKLRERDD
jgi:hypothetical protein